MQCIDHTATHDGTSRSLPHQQNPLSPKELFPDIAREEDEFIQKYEYASPMEKHLRRVLDQIESKESEIECIKNKLDEATKNLGDDDFDCRPSCGKCHQPGHKKNKCAGPPCPASVSCGKLRLHKDELKSNESMKASMKKILKERSILESESQRIQENITANTCSFPNAIRSHLINSNKCKYLTWYGNEIVPLSRIINLDISILQKYYKNKVPDDIEMEASNFEHILMVHSNKFKTAETSISSKLLDSVRKVDARIKPSDIMAHSSPLSCPTNLNLHSPPNSFQTPLAQCQQMSQETTTSNQQIFCPTNTPSHIASNIPAFINSSVDRITSKFQNLNSPPKPTHGSTDVVNPTHNTHCNQSYSTPNPFSYTLYMDAHTDDRRTPGYDTPKRPRYNYPTLDVGSSMYRPPLQLSQPPPNIALMSSSLKIDHHDHSRYNSPTPDVGPSISRPPSHFSQHPDHYFSFDYKQHATQHVSLYPVDTPRVPGKNKYSWYSLPSANTENRNPANVATMTQTFSPQKYFNHKSHDSCDTHRQKRIQMDKNMYSPTYQPDKAVDKQSPVDSVSKSSGKSLGSDPHDQADKPVDLVMRHNPGHTNYADKKCDGDHESTDGNHSGDYSHIYEEFNVNKEASWLYAELCAHKI